MVAAVIPLANGLGNGNYTVVVTVTDEAGNSVTNPRFAYSATSILLPAGDNEAVISHRDTAFNVGENLTVHLNVSSSAPTVNPLITNNTLPTITGTALVNLGAGETLTVEVDGVPYTAGDGNLFYNSGDNSWALTIPFGNELNPDGDYSVVASVDGGGTGNAIITVDTVLPDPIDPVGDVVSSLMYPTLTGTGLDDSSHTVVVQVLVDGMADQPTFIGGPMSIAVDDGGAGYTSVPTVTITGGGATSDATATATVDFNTGEVTGITITDAGSGYTSEPTVTITNGGATSDATATATLVNDGTWSVISPVPIPEGTWNLRITQRDAAGNENILTGSNGTLTVDTTTPQPPRFDFIPVSKTSTPTITGTGEPGATIDIKATGGGLVDEPLVDFLTGITITDPGAGYTSVPLVTITGGGGNGATATATIDVATGFLTGIIITDPGAGYTSVPTVTIDTNGGATSNATATASILVTVDQNGSWLVTSGRTFTDEEITLTATQTDAADNESDPQTASFVVDTSVGPVAVAFDTLPVTNDPNPVISGTGEPYRIVVVSADVDPDPAITQLETIGEVVVDGLGNWSTVSLLPLPGGIIDLSAAQTDISAAQILATETEVADRLGTDVPGTIEIIPLIAAAAPVFDPTSLGITNNQTPEIRGTGGAGNTVVVFTDADADGVPDTVLGTASVGVVDNINITNGGSTYTFALVTITGGGGNGATATATIEAGVITAIEITNPGRGYTSAPDVTIGGDGNDADAEATIINTWSLTPIVSLDEGVFQLVAFEVDPAGNVSESTLASIEIDLTAPATPLFDSENSLLTNNQQPLITGTGEVGSIVEVTATGGGLANEPLGTVTVDDNGDWEVPAGVLLPEGKIALVAEATDLATNVSNKSTLPIVIDITAPTILTIDGASLQVTNDGTPTITGTGDEENAIVELRGDTNGNGTQELIGTALVGGDNRWSITPTSIDPENLLVLSEGIITLSVTQTDAAGNESTVPVVGQIEIDQTAPLFSDPLTPTTITLAADPFNDSGISSDDGLSNDGAFTLSVNGDTSGALKDLTITNAGTGYTSEPTVTITGGGAAQDATATATINMFVDSITVDDGGAGYTSAPTVTITDGGGAGATATATIDVATGLLTGITIDDPGAGYTSEPTVTITGGGAAQDATATASLNGLLSDITIDDPGAGYTSAPIVTITGGGATQDATATASLHFEPTSVVFNLLTISNGISVFEDSFNTKLGPLRGLKWDETGDTQNLTEDGVYLYQATAEDAAGNKGYSNLLRIEIDNTNPAVPTVDADSVEITSDQRPPITGSGDSGATIEIRATSALAGVNNQLFGTTVVNANGTWSVTPDFDLALADAVFTQYDLSITQMDEAGNLSDQIASEIVISTEAPEAPQINELSPDTTNSPQNAPFWLTGIGRPGATVTVFNNPVEVGQTRVSASNDVVVAAHITNGGAGYTSAPTVTITGGGNSPATATATIDFALGLLAGITITDGGAGYATAPTVTITGGGATQDATATATIDVDTGVLTGITITDPGVGYTSAPTVTLTGGVNVATATATIDAGVVDGITIDDSGAGYIPAPTVIITGGGATSGATATATIVAGVVAGITIDDPGVGYTSAPTVTITGGNATQDATATATIDPVSGEVTGFVVTDPGAGYVAPLTVTIIGGGGTDATATAIMGGSWRFWVEPIVSDTVDFTATQTFYPDNPATDSLPSASFTLELIAELPGVPVINSLSVGNNQQPTITGTGENENTITLLADVVIDGSDAAQTILGTYSLGGNNWKISSPIDLPEGDVTLVAVQTNRAGTSVGSATASNTIDKVEIDTTAPGEPTIDTLQDTPIQTPVITGTGEPGATIEVQATGGGLTDQPLVGILTTIAISDPGIGYTSAPTVTITGGGATSDATATATIDLGTGLLTVITIDDPGAGYTSVPTVTITGGGRR